MKFNFKIGDEVLYKQFYNSMWKIGKLNYHHKSQKGKHLNFFLVDKTPAKFITKYCVKNLELLNTNKHFNVDYLSCKENF